MPGKVCGCGAAAADAVRVLKENAELSATLGPSDRKIRSFLDVELKTIRERCDLEPTMTKCLSKEIVEFDPLGKTKALVQEGHWDSAAEMLIQELVHYEVQKER